MKNNTEKIYMRYIKSREQNSNSAFGLHTLTNGNDIIDNYRDSHNRIRKSININEDIAQEFADRIGELLDL